MNLSNDDYREKIRKILNGELQSNHNIYDAFFQLLRDVNIEALENLLKAMISDKEFNPNNQLSINDCYVTTQNTKAPLEIKRKVFNLAFTLLDNGFLLSSKTDELGHNISGFLSHSMYEAKLCAILATKCDLDEEEAFKLGLLHDYGRKYSHSFSHTIIGFEKLVDAGYFSESLACLSHSFLNGNYFAVYQPSDKYIVDDNLNAIPISNDVIDNDIFHFLEVYQYTPYDRILNIADLMSTSQMITSPVDRILDIEKRRKMEGRQRAFYLNELLKTINWYLNCLEKDEAPDLIEASRIIYGIVLDDKTISKIFNKKNTNQ